MNALYEALKYHLWNDSAVEDLIGQRVYPAGSTPSNAAFPHATYAKTLTDRARHQGGSGGLVMTMLAINCWAITAQSAAQVRDAVHASLDEFVGAFGDPGSPLEVRLITLDNESNESSAPIDSTEQGPFVETLEVTVWHAETPTPIPAGS